MPLSTPLIFLFRALYSLIANTIFASLSITAGMLKSVDFTHF